MVKRSAKAAVGILVLALLFATGAFLLTAPRASLPGRASVAPPEPAEFFGFPVRSAASREKSSRLVLKLIPGKCAAGFDGSSTLHDFTGVTSAVVGRLEFDTARLEETARGEIVIQARTLNTGNVDRDRDMHGQYLESETYPDLKFSLQGVARGSRSGERTLRGRLELHGTQKEVRFDASVELRDDGILHAKGEIPAKLTEFGITPPSKLGFIKMADEIKIWFEIWAEPES